MSKNYPEVGDKVQKPFPQGLKPSHIFSHLRHPSTALRAGFEVVPFQSNTSFYTGSQSGT
jgi:hypothetical protein